MRLSKTRKLAGGATVGLILGGLLGLSGLAGCAANEEQPAGGGTGNSAGSAGAGLTGELNGAGASSQSAAQEAWRGGFAAIEAGVNVNYDPVGSGDGRTQFTAGGLGFVGTDAPFKADEAKGGHGSCAADSPLVEVPVYISPIAVAFNLDGVTELNLAPNVIAHIFTGGITNWNDPAIKADNPDVDLPDLPISPVHRSDKSGTTGNFTDYLTATAPEAWTAGETEEWPESGGEGAEKTQGMVQALTAGKGSIGYVDAGQAQDLSWASIKVGDQWVKPSAEGAAKAVAESELESGRGEGDVVYSLNRTTEAAGAYPLILVSYLAACEKYSDPKTAELVSAYLKYVVSEEGQKAAAENAGSAPLTSEADLTAKVNAAVARIGS
ncbi:MAG: phosphate ABC transporter substrate-binding protein PstS [Bifidobacteriaceae bacterium]|jgi:phosphate transport system substrate-binding protein|nr:phosphate ABC transporter substrate-binding protein PstS [Bifidobacteriaceae bacterium]